MKRGAYTEADIDRWVEEYGRGDSPNVIGARYGFHGDTVRRRLEDRGVKLRNLSTAQKARYKGTGGDVLGLANEIGISEREAYDLLLRHGFIYRKPSHGKEK